MANSPRAARRSFSALCTHSAVSFFIEHLAPGHNLPQKPIPPTQPLFEDARCPHQEVERKSALDRLCDAHRLTELVASRHDDEEVNIAVGRGRAVGVGTEQDDLIRVELLDDLPSVAA